MSASEARPSAWAAVSRSASFWEMGEVARGEVGEYGKCSCSCSCSCSCAPRVESDSEDQMEARSKDLREVVWMPAGYQRR